MAWVFLFFLLAWPVMEFSAFAQVAQWVGTPLAIAGLFLSAMLGVAVLRSQSLTTARQVQIQMNRGQLPVRELFDAAAVSLGGLLLILPGYVTDLIGLLLLLPPVRKLLYGEAAFLLKTSMKARGQAGGLGNSQGKGRRNPPGQEEASADVTIIEADYTVVSHGEGGHGGPSQDGPRRGRPSRDDQARDDQDPPTYGGGGSGGSGAGGGKPSIRLLL